MLRAELDSITDEPDVSSHPDLIAALQYPHTIHCLQSDRPIDGYTCFMHVLGLYDQDSYVAVATSGDGSVFANSTFVAYLIETSVLCEKQDFVPGDIVLYFLDGTPVHAGIVVGDDRVVSKWGIGHLYEHNISDVPAKYGQEIHYYHPITPDATLRHFMEYATQRGVIES